MKIPTISALALLALTLPSVAETCNVKWKDGGKLLLSLKGNKIAATHYYKGKPVTWTNTLIGSLRNGKFKSPNTGRWFTIKGSRIYTGAKGKSRDNSGRISC